MAGTTKQEPVGDMLMALENFVRTGITSHRTELRAAARTGMLTRKGQRKLAKLERYQGGK